MPTPVKRARSIAQIIAKSSVMPLSDDKIILFPQRVAENKIPPDTVAVIDKRLDEGIRRALRNRANGR